MGEACGPRVPALETQVRPHARLYPVRRPHGRPHQVNVHVTDPRHGPPLLFGVAEDLGARRAGRGGQAHVHVHVRAVETDVVDEPEIDDVEVQLGVLHTAEREPDQVFGELAGRGQGLAVGSLRHLFLLGSLGFFAVVVLAATGFAGLDCGDLFFAFTLCPAVVDAAVDAFTAADGRLIIPLRRAERATRTARFQPTARSARNETGISATARVASVTARAAASARSARTSAMTFAAPFARASCTRFVSRITNISRSGSIQIDVPVNPVWP